VERIKQILAEIGLEPERVRMVNLSSAMATQFVQSVTEMVKQVQALGPNPLRLAVKIKDTSPPGKGDLEEEVI
jgi:F420-non-reducing hydrogenase iron-sulfur subunit